MASGDKKSGSLLAAVVTFLVVAGGIYLTGSIATWLLKKVVLPILAVAMGWIAARVVYRFGDRG